MTAHGATDAILNTILSDSGIVVLEAHTDGTYAILSRIPDWMASLAPERVVGDTISALGDFPLLDHFLVSARDHWQDGSDVIEVRSGMWIETIEDREVPLEAIARRIQGRRLLILVSPVERHERQRARQQVMREEQLAKEQLEFAVQERTEMIRAREEEIAMRLVSAAEFRDTETGAHTRRIGRLTALVGSELGLPRAQLQHLDLAASMHDVGKIGIPDQILLKPGPLDDEERSIMQRHTLLGADILDGSDAAALQMARRIALSHHERWDGAGYPHGLSGRKIPVEARIVSVVDFFDATMSDRPYRPAMDRRDVIDLMKSERGRHFDPEILDTFLAIQPKVESARKEIDAAFSTSAPKR